MIGLVSLIIITSFSMLVVRVGAMALTMTGVSKDVASFQAKSAYTGVGFTTSEAELIVNHPVRRRVISTLVTLGQIGIPAVLAALLVSMLDAESGGLGLLYMLIAAAIAIGMLALSRTKMVDVVLNRLITRALKRWTKLDVMDYTSVLEMERGYRITRLKVLKGSWLSSGKSLRDMRLSDAGVIVLGFHRTNDYIATPSADTVFEVDDEIICYGTEAILDDLATRKRGREGAKRAKIAKQKHEEELDENARILERASMRASGVSNAVED